MKKFFGVAKPFEKIVGFTRKSTFDRFACWKTQRLNCQYYIKIYDFSVEFSFIFIMSCRCRVEGKFNTKTNSAEKFNE